MNGEKFFQYMVQPIFTSLPPPPPTTTTKKICFKRLKRRGWYKLKSVPRGDVGGSRGSHKERKWSLVAEEESDFVCEMLWPTSRLTGWVRVRMTDGCSRYFFNFGSKFAHVTVFLSDCLSSTCHSVHLLLFFTLYVIAPLHLLVYMRHLIDIHVIHVHQ